MGNIFLVEYGLRDFKLKLFVYRFYFAVNICPSENTWRTYSLKTILLKTQGSTKADFLTYCPLMVKSN